MSRLWTRHLFTCKRCGVPHPRRFRWRGAIRGWHTVGGAS
jgi:hypothetical protein